MISIWCISTVALLLNPIIGFFAIRQTKNKPALRKLFLKISLGLISIIAISLLTKITTTSLLVNWVLLGLAYLAFCVIVWFGQFQRNKFISILSIFTIIVVFGIGYIVSTIGFLGLGLILNEFEPAKELRINDQTVYKEFRIGNAISDCRGTKVCLYRNYQSFPFFERNYFSKDYVEGLNIENNEESITHRDSNVNSCPTFFGVDLIVRYDTVHNEIIISNNMLQDTLKLSKQN